MIHYHGTPCGGTREENVRFLRGRHAMIPFPRPENLAIAMEVCQSFCVDNGAFTLWKQGGSLDVSAYYDWVNSIRLHPAFDWALIPDVIDGDEATNDALLAQWPFGNDGVPVWYLHESLSRLRYLCGAWPRVALGSSGQWPTPGITSWWERMAEAMEAICDGRGNPRCKLHGLRMLNPEVFRYLPLASADSTNAVRNGNLVTKFGMYPPPSLGQRQNVIADRIEAYQSAAAWVAGPKEVDLFAELV